LGRSAVNTALPTHARIIRFLTQEIIDFPCLPESDCGTPKDPDLRIQLKEISR